MESERWKRIEALFHRAADLAADERAALLDRECGSDRELRREVELLLANDAAGDDAFSRVETRTRTAGEDPMLGRTLGVYALTERLGAGGMGVVYRARRADGLFEQEVAIKLIRAERATEWMLRRFEFERRTLAALQHPSIARLYDGGTTDEGCPYLVMELVRGETIDRYAESQRLPLAARLRLFAQVCRAVHYAHQNLVVHCDLKPANILIDERGQPRLLDFGIARLLEEEPDEATPDAPRTLARVLTPEYASPEQLAGGAVTTALDVYSLGVVLYELLTGRRPFQSDSRSPADWERLIRERTPERPSTRVFRADSAREPGAIAATFKSTPAGLKRALRGDLDRIVLMALRKEPERRYASAQELADDLERHLAGQPVRARADSIVYVAWKFVRRNRVAVAAGVAVLAALLYGLFSARRSERLAEAEAAHARMEADSFQSISDFLMDAFLPAQPSQDAAWQAHAQKLIVAHAERVHRQYARNDHVRANLLDTLGRVCMRLDLLDDAHRLLGEAAEIRERAFGRDSLEYAISLRGQGQFAYQVGEFERAVELLTEALQVNRAAGPNRHAEVDSVANDLAACLRNLGRDDDAEALHREALALRRADDDGSLPVAESLNNLAIVHQGRGELELAITELREALAIRGGIFGDAHPLTLQTLSNLAATLWRKGERDEAGLAMRRAEAGYRALGGDGEEGLGSVLSSLATMHLAVGDVAAAAPALEEGLALQTKRLGPEHPEVSRTLSKLALLYHAEKRDDRARECWEEVLRIRRGPDIPPALLAEGLHGYGVFLSDVGECERAIPSFEEALALLRAQASGDPLAPARAEYVLGLCLARVGRPDAAREHLTEAARLYDATPGAPAAERERVQRNLDELAAPVDR
ncbi:MAG: tetratricopeptide repeat protein [Planctomycetes bacterium]|nr:tetratricopeptide repeat protein [Planctomycetota bacterium]